MHNYQFEPEELKDWELGPRAQSDQKLLAAVAKHWPLSHVLKAQDIGGTYNLNLHIQTATGAYVVRVHRPWVTYDRLAMIHTVRKALSAAGFPVPDPLMTASGETTLRYGDRLIEIEDFVHHDAIADNWERYAVAYSMLGKLHNFFAEAIGVASVVPPRVSNYGTPAMLLHWVEHTEKAIHQSEHAAEAAYALQICAEARVLLLRMWEWWQKTGNQLPTQPIHGDYGGGNLLFDEGQLVAILDFDFLAVRERIYDVAYCLYWMFRRLEAAKTPAHWSWEQARTMLQCYNSVSTQPLNIVEMRSILIEMARIPLYWIAEAGFTPNPAQTVVSLIDNVQFSRWLLQHCEEVAALL